MRECHMIAITYCKQVTIYSAKKLLLPLFTLPASPHRPITASHLVPIRVRCNRHILLRHAVCLCLCHRLCHRNTNCTILHHTRTTGNRCGHGIHRSAVAHFLREEFMPRGHHLVVHLRIRSTECSRRSCEADEYSSYC